MKFQKLCDSIELQRKLEWAKKEKLAKTRWNHLKAPNVDDLRDPNDRYLIYNLTTKFKQDNKMKELQLKR